MRLGRRERPTNQRAVGGYISLPVISKKILYFPHFTPYTFQALNIHYKRKICQEKIRKFAYWGNIKSTPKTAPPKALPPDMPPDAQVE